MKKYPILLIVQLMIFVHLLPAQISEAESSMSKGMHNALILDIPNMDSKFVDGLWKDYLKDFYRVKPKYDRKINEWVAQEAEIVAIGGSDPVDLYTKVITRGEGAQVNLWVYLGDRYLSSESDPDIFPEAEKLLIRFGLEVARADTKLELEEEEKELDKMERELEKLQRNNERYHEKIQDLEKDISQAERDLSKNEKDRKKMESRIKDQEGQISQAAENKNLEAMEKEEDALKDLQKELKKLESDHRKYGNTIESSKDRIRKFEKDLIENERQQEAIRQQITDQNKVIEQVREKLNEL